MPLENLHERPGMGRREELSQRGGFPILTTGAEPAAAVGTAKPLAAGVAFDL